MFQRNFTASFIKVGHLPWGWNQEYHLKSGTLLKDYVTSHSRRQQSLQSPMSEPTISQTRHYSYFHIWKVQKELAWVISFFNALPYTFMFHHIFHPFRFRMKSPLTLSHYDPQQVSTWIGNSESTCKLYWKTRK